MDGDTWRSAVKLALAIVIAATNAAVTAPGNTARAAGVFAGTLFVLYLIGRVLTGVWVLVQRWRAAVAEAEAQARADEG